MLFLAEGCKYKTLLEIKFFHTKHLAFSSILLFWDKNVRSGTYLHPSAETKGPDLHMPWTFIPVCLDNIDMK